LRSAQRQNGQRHGNDDHRDQRGGDKPEAIHDSYLSKLCEMIEPRKRGAPPVVSALVWHRRPSISGAQGSEITNEGGFDPSKR
jgi:hypothetical protein